MLFARHTASDREQADTDPANFEREEGELDRLVRFIETTTAEARR